MAAAPLAGFAGIAGSAASIASIGEFGPSSCIASLATSAAISLMRSRSSAFSMRSVAQELSACCWIALMSRCSLARSSRAIRSCSSTAAFSAFSFSSAGHYAAVGEVDFVAQFLGGAFGGLFRLAQLIVLIVALGQKLALGGKARFQVVDAVAEHFGFLDLDDQLAIEIGDPLAQVLDPAARLGEFARRGFGLAALLFEPRLRGGEFLFGVADAVLQRVDLGAHRDQLDLAALGRHRTVGQLG